MDLGSAQDMSHHCDPAGRNKLRLDYGEITS